MNQILLCIFLVFLISMFSFSSFPFIKAENSKSEIDIEDISWSPKEPKKGDTIQFTIKIKNNLDTRYKNLRLECYINKELIESKIINEINEKTIYEHTFDWEVNTLDFKITSIIISNKNNQEINSFSKLYFSGYSWYIKRSIDDRKGPGYNYWADSNENVWVDEKGLHLKITENDGGWYCSEVYSEESFGYGKYVFYLDGRPDVFDRNVVLGLFTYYYNSKELDKNVEIDIEFSKWGSHLPNILSKNSQFVTYPITKKTIYRYKMILNGDYSVHYFDWKKNSIEFKSLHGHDEATSSRRLLIAHRIFSGEKIPIPTTETKVHINLWLFDSNSDKKGDSPSDGKETEIIVKAFRFE